MITGIGTDIVDIRRIKKLLQRFPVRFTQKVFTLSEQDYCNSRKDPATAYAKRFAAKEAFLKALGTGMRQGISWQNICVTHTSLGQPKIEAPKLLKNTQQCHLSLSDEYPYAIGYVVIAQSQNTGTTQTGVCSR